MALLHQILRGMVIGVANIIPGVSGGTMMVSMGIYDTLIHCITHLFSEFKKSIRTLLPYGIGVLIGIVALASMLEYLFGHYALPTSTTFVGLILGGLSPIVAKIERKKINMSSCLIFLLSFALIVVLSFVGQQSNPESLPLNLGTVVTMLFMGVVASATMLVPGVSGSMVLMLLGYYEPTIHALTTLKDAVFALDIAAALTPLGLLLPFGVGVAVGIFAVAKGIEWLLHRYPTQTYCGVLGLVVSSPIAILCRVDMTGLQWGAIVVSVVTFAVGFVCAWLLAKGEQKK